MSINNASDTLTVSDETPIGYMLHSAQSDTRLREYMEIIYSGNNIPWMLERNGPYDTMMKRGYRSIGEVIRYLESFSIIKTCGVLHERDHAVNKKNYNAWHCPSQKWNICCTHPEESGLLFGIFAWLSIINYFYPSKIDPTPIWESIAKLRKLDRKTGERDREIVYWTKSDIINGQSAQLRSDTIASQKEISWTLQRQISLILKELKDIITSGKPLPDKTSQPLIQIPKTIDAIMKD